MWPRAGCKNFGRRAKEWDRGGRAVYLDSSNANTTLMRIYPAPRYTMEDLWVDYHLRSTVPGLFVLSEAKRLSQLLTAELRLPN